MILVFPLLLFFSCGFLCSLSPNSLAQIRSEAQRKSILQEVFALAAIHNCEHVVRYYTAWEEDGRFYIVTELLEGTLKQIRATFAGKREQVRLPSSSLPLPSFLLFSLTRIVMVYCLGYSSTSVCV